MANIIDSVVTIKETFDKDEFIRRVLIKITADPSTPVGISTATFGEVKMHYEEALLYSAHAELSYTASVGYDREEQYIDREKRWDAEIGTYYVNVVKWRTVTDWSPFSGHIGGDTTCVISNDESLSDVDYHSLLNSVNFKGDMGGEAALSSSTVSRLKQQCEDNVEDTIRYPGDHVKNKQIQSTVELQHVFLFKIPVYEVSYTFDEKTYNAKCYAIPKDDLKVETPPSNDSAIIKVAREKTKKKKNGATLSWCIFAVLYAAAFALCIMGIIYFGVAFAAAMYVLSVCLHVSYNKKYNELLKNMMTDSIQTKVDELKEVLKKREYKELSDKELEQFDSKSNVSAFNYRYRKRGFLAPTILFAFAIAILLVMSVLLGLNH